MSQPRDYSHRMVPVTSERVSYGDRCCRGKLAREDGSARGRWRYRGRRGRRLFGARQGAWAGDLEAAARVEIRAWSWAGRAIGLGEWEVVARCCCVRD